MMNMPRGTIVLIAVAIFVGAVLTWTAHRARPASRLDSLWRTFEDYVTNSLTLIMVCAAVLQVAARFLLAGRLNVTWTEELASLAMVWLSFWAGAAVSRQKDHMCLTVLYDVMPASMQRWVDVFGDVATIAVVAPVAWFGFADARMQDVISTVSLGIPIAVFAFVVPVGMTLVALHSAARLAEHVRSGCSLKARRLSMKEAS